MHTTCQALRGGRTCKAQARSARTVSYKILTLTTNLDVYISVVSLSIKINQCLDPNCHVTAPHPVDMDFSIQVDITSSDALQVRLHKVYYGGGVALYNIYNVIMYCCLNVCVILIYSAQLLNLR